MPAVTTAYAKNIIRRAFREIIDQTPPKQAADNIWDFFASECAYCGVKLNRNNKEGHIDHLISASKGGRNHFANRVLSCATCNEKEKRDLPWEEFLATKVTDQKLLGIRRKKILDWQAKNSDNLTVDFQHLVSLADSLANEVVNAFELKIVELKKQKQNLKN